MLKGCQILSVVGAVAGVACKAISYRNMRSHTIRLGLYSGARYGMLLGVPVGVAATWFRMHHVEQLKQVSEFYCSQLYVFIIIVVLCFPSHKIYYFGRLDL